MAATTIFLLAADFISNLLRIENARVAEATRAFTIASHFGVASALSLTI